MKTTNVWEVQPRSRRVAVGEFDGVHLGHREVIRGSDTVLTFEPHPLQIIRPEAAPKLLTSFDGRAELIASLGVEELVVIPFDDHFAHQSPQEFIDHILVDRLQATHVSVGENFRFGHRAVGDTEMLGDDPRFETRVVSLVEVDGEVVSSSHIRALVTAGDVEEATRMLGAPFQMRGEVVTGDQRGRALGFPTANVVPDEALICPGHGVYAARADGAPAAVSVGVRPTFGTGRGVLVEAYLLDQDVDLYGHVLQVEFLARLRGERRFDSAETLIEQMHEDVRQTRERFG
jgi:riboflavin kinase / FMN adenylyltransferase